MDQIKHRLSGLGGFAKENLPPTVTSGVSVSVSDLTSSVRRKLTLSSRRKTQPIDDEEAGDIIPSDSHAGGGHSTFTSSPSQSPLRVSPALQSFLARNHILSPHESVSDLLSKPHIQVPEEVVSRDHPLPEYFVSSSHNTYLMAHQLFGESSADPYLHTLQAGSRCVEIDVWDNPDNLDEPKVTHGYTLVSNIPFREVCGIILRGLVLEEEQVQKEGEGGVAPVLISLENHCNERGQEALVRIMKEVWGGRLLDEPVTAEGHIEQDQHVPLRELGGRIVVIVEHHLANESNSSDSSSDSSSSSDDEASRTEKRQRKQTPSSTLIIPPLASLGVYGQSVKPIDASWYSTTTYTLKDGPHHHLINISESGLSSLLSAGNGAAIARHNARHLMRVYPKGTRISSKNLKQLPFWALGAQVCALNWQTFDASMQINEAMFAGTGGYVLKPGWLRTNSAMVGLDDKQFREAVARSRKRKRLRLHVAGASDVPVPGGRDEDKELKPYLTCTLLHPGVPFGELQQTKKKTEVFRRHKLTALIGGLTGAVAREDDGSVNDPVWDETLEWEYEDDELVFLRMFVKSDDSFSSNPVLCVASVRLLYVEATKGQWRFVRMLDLKGRETRCSLLVKFEVEEI